MKLGTLNYSTRQCHQSINSIPRNLRAQPSHSFQVVDSNGDRFQATVYSYKPLTDGEQTQRTNNKADNSLERIVNRIITNREQDPGTNPWLGRATWSIFTSPGSFGYPGSPLIGGGTGGNETENLRALGVHFIEFKKLN